MQCPNCSAHIGRFDLSPNCKHCGVNIFYSQQKKLLTDDAKMCELEYATLRIFVAKLKATFIKGVVPILRIVSMLLAIGAICVPFATVSTVLPLLSSEFSFGAVGIYLAFSNGTLKALLNLYDYIPIQVSVCIALLTLMVVIFLVGLGVFVSLLLSFINLKKSAKIMRGLSVVGVTLCIVSVVLSLLMPSIISQSGFLIAKSGLGSFVCVGVFVLIYILNHLFIKKNIEADIKEVDVKRIELRKKVKSGEVSLGELSLPVFESEEEKEKRLEEEEKSRLLAEKAKGGERGE